MSPPGQKVSKMLLGKAGGKLVIAPVRMKWLGQSRNAAQLWVCLVEGKASAVKNSSASQVALVLKNRHTNAGDIREAVPIPGSGRFPGGGPGNPLQYPCLENPMDRGTWWATFHKVTKSWT